MPTQCNAEQLEFSSVERRQVVAAFDGGRVSSDAGALLLGKADAAIGLIDRLATCFTDHRRPELIEHSVRTLVGQRVFGLALGHEDLNDHEQLRHDPVMGALLGKLTARRADCAALAGKSTLNRLELFTDQSVDRYHKIIADPEAMDRLWVELFLEAPRRAPQRIVLDLDATDDPLHGNQEGRFFHGYYNHYCYLPLYIFCGEHLLCARLRRANIDGAAGARDEVQRIVAQIRARDEANETLLMLAARHGDGAMAGALIAAGAEVDYVEPRFSQDALMIAVRSGNASVVEALINAGAKLDHQTPPGPEPTTREPGAGGGSTGEGMIRSGVPPEGQRLAGTGGMTALLYAARDDQAEAARLLVKARAPLEQAEYNGITPLLMAITNDHYDLAPLLIEAGANVNAGDWYGRQPLWAAIEGRNRDVESATVTTNGVDREAALRVITLLVERGADVNARTKHFPPRMGGHTFNMSYVSTVGETPIFRAAFNNDLDVMRLLLAAGADPLLKTDSGTSPLMAAAGVNFVRGQTFVPGGYAAQLEAVKLLVELGADVNEANEMGLAPLHGAAFRWSDEVISYLVAKGARLDAKDAVGRDPLQWASGVTIPSTPPEPNPRTMALIEKLLAEGSGSRQ